MRNQVLEMIINNEIDFNLIPELREADGLPGGEHHNEDVLTHCRLAMEFLPSDKPLLKLAGLLHDCGKPVCYRENGNFHGHEERGVEVAREILTRLGFSSSEIEYVTALIDIHMIDVEVIKPSRLKSKLLHLQEVGASWQDFLAIRLADRKANLKKQGTPNMRSFVRACKNALAYSSPVVSKSTLAVSGNDVIAIRKVAQGPEVGKFLAILKDMVDNGFPNDRAQLLDALAKI